MSFFILEKLSAGKLSLLIRPTFLLLIFLLLVCEYDTFVLIKVFSHFLKLFLDGTLEPSHKFLASWWSFAEFGTFIELLLLFIKCRSFFTLLNVSGLLDKTFVLIFHLIVKFFVLFEVLLFFSEHPVNFIVHGELQFIYQLPFCIFWCLIRLSLIQKRFLVSYVKLAKFLSFLIHVLLV